MLSLSLYTRSCRLVCSLFPAVLLCLPATVAQAQATLTFEDLPNPNSGMGGQITQPTPYSAYGFTLSDDFGNLHSVTPDAGSTVYNYTGSVALFSGGDGSTITLTHDNAVPFTLNSIDIANLQQASSGVTVTFTGYQQGGGTLNQTFTHGANNNLETVAFSGWTNLTSFTFQQNAPYNQFDNVVLDGGAPTATATPEPGSIALLAGLGLSSGMLLKRRRK